VGFGFLVVTLLGAVFVVAARAIVLFGFVFLDDFFVVLGAKRTLTNHCLPISIYEFTP
jgi:hypothetical protein